MPSPHGIRGSQEPGGDGPALFDCEQARQQLQAVGRGGRVADLGLKGQSLAGTGASGPDVAFQAAQTSKAFQGQGLRHLVAAPTSEEQCVVEVGAPAWQITVGQGRLPSADQGTGEQVGKSGPPGDRGRLVEQRLRPLGVTLL